MKPAISLAFALAACALALPACSTTERSSGGAGGTAPDAEFKTLMDGYYNSWTVQGGNNSQVSGTASKYFAKNADLVFFDLAPMQYHGWAEYQAGVNKHFIDEVESCMLVPNDDLRVTRHGSVAWTTDTLRVKGKMKAGAPIDIAARHTAIWEKQGGSWVIVHEHLSAPLH